MARPVCDSRRVVGIKSIVGGGTLDQDVALQLSGDVQSPGPGYGYGTDSTGKKGWYPLPPGAESLAALQAQIAALELRIIALESAADPVVVITGVSYAVASNVTMVEASAPDITITLPSPVAILNVGRLLTVKNLSSGRVTVSCAAPIDSATSWTLSDGEAMTLRSDGVVWCVV